MISLRERLSPKSKSWKPERRSSLPGSESVENLDIQCLDASVAAGGDQEQSIIGGWSLKATKIVTVFLSGAMKDEWLAAPLSFLAAVPSNAFTAFSVAWLAPWIGRRLGEGQSTGFMLATSTAAVVIGYASYISLYYGFLAYKDRDLYRYQDGRFDGRRFFRFVAIDNINHLPEDIFTISGIGIFQVGLLASGATDLFWSILASQMTFDMYDCLKEPFYCRASKILEKQASEILGQRAAEKSLSSRTEPRNADAIPPGNMKASDSSTQIANG